MIDVDFELLLRYRGGECTPEERARFDGWLAANPRHAKFYQDMITARTLWLTESSGGSGPQEVRVPAATPPPEPTSAPTIPPTPPLGPSPMAARAAPSSTRTTALAQRPMRLALPIAAMVVVAVGSLLTWRAISSPNASERGEEPVMRTVSTERGERAELRLGDGTRVVLAAVSTLRYPADFGARSREVHLEGEAYFDVVHDARNPFVVRAGAAIAEDLGTAFVVRAYPNDPAAEVVVTSGKVALRAAEPGAPGGPVLTHGQLGRFTKADRAVKVETVNVDDYTGWTEGRFVFDGVPLSEVLIRLQRWYDVELRLADSTLSSDRITASFQDKTITQILDLLAASLDVRYERQGRTIVLHPRSNGTQ